MKKTSLSIILPARNEEDFISRSLQAINQLCRNTMKIETIVVDNGSTDNTVLVSRAHGARVLSKPEGTIASLRNFGAEASTGYLLAFLDADCVVPSDWLEKALVHLDKSDKIAVGFKYSLPPNCNWIAKSWDLMFTDRYFTSEVNWVPSGNMIMAREAFTSVGGFDEELETNEDYDFCLRLRNEGFKVISSAETAVLHLRPPQSILQLFRKELWHGKEIFTSFINEVLRKKDLRIYRAKNFPVLLYSIFFLVAVLLIFLSTVLSIYANSLVYFVLAVILMSLPPFCIALKKVLRVRKYKFIFGLTFVLITYGIARAFGLLLYSKSLR